MIKTIVFDLDGVLCDTKELHFEALNLALVDIDKKYVISYQEHLKIYDGLPTKRKLELLNQHKGLDRSHFLKIWKDKQLYTEKLLHEQIKEDENLIRLFTMLLLSPSQYNIYVATNSIKQTTELILTKLGIINLLDGYLTNEDVKCQAKPHPSIYLQCMLESCSAPNETLVIEDSINGIKAAQDSGAHVLIVKDRSEVTFYNIMDKIKEIENGNTKKKFPFNGRVLVLAAGAGSRFEKAGYSYPKPIIDVLGKPMIGWVVDSLNLDCEYIYLFQKSHLDRYNIKQMVNLLTPKNQVIEVDGITEGAACTALLAQNLINDDKPLFIINSDQYFEFDINQFLYLMNNSNVDGGILTFDNLHPKWSYAAIDQDGFVTRVEEKNPISNHATVGCYYFKKGSYFVKYANLMIDKDIRTKGEFYLAPCYNEFIKDGKKIKIFNVDKMEGLGDPESLQLFINNRK